MLPERWGAFFAGDIDNTHHLCEEAKDALAGVTLTPLITLDQSIFRIELKATHSILPQNTQ